MYAKFLNVFSHVDTEFCRLQLDLWIVIIKGEKIGLIFESRIKATKFSSKCEPPKTRTMKHNVITMVEILCLCSACVRHVWHL